MQTITQPVSAKREEFRPTPSRRRFEVIVIGAGFAGIGAAIKLREAGLDFLVLEKSDEIGGVWRDNSYPDCACDVPSPLYSYSFAPNPHWGRFFAEQEEIKAYARKTAKEFEVIESILVNRELLNATWNKNERVWELQTNAGMYFARFAIFACGPMHEPAIPAVRGMESFQGATFHSARWDHDYDLANKRVAVIGTGASAIQFVPAIQPKVKQLTVFQRTAPWVLPKMDFKVSSRWKRIFERLPIVQSILRALLYFQFEFLNRSLKHPRLVKRLQSVARKNIYRGVKDGGLRAALTPNFTIGCKRILQSNKWYPALAQPNVDVVGAVAEIRGNRVIADDGSSCVVDAIIFGTGFQVANPPIAERIVGASGVSLAKQWDGSPKAYLGTTAPDCPNCFLTFGPNLYTFSSAFVILEAQLKYIMSALEKVRANNIVSVTVDTRKCAQHNEALQSSLQETVWNVGGCSSYFIDKNGANSTNWPWTTFYMRKRMRKFALNDYTVETGDVESARATC